MRDQILERYMSRQRQCRFGFGDCRSPARFIRGGVGERADPASVAKRREGGRVHRMQVQARIGQPLGELKPCSLVVIVEVRPGGEELDRLESVRGDVDQVIPRELMFVKEMCRDAEPFGHELYCLSSSTCAASSSRRRVNRG